MEDIMNIIDAFDIDIATESFGDASNFLRDPYIYLDRSNSSNPDKNGLYTSDLDTNGCVYTTITKACDELVKVNAYQEAIKMLTTFIDLMNDIKKNNEHVTPDDIENLNWSISEVQNKTMDVCKMRDEYTSKRKEILAKYSLLYED